ncbi:MAG: hypothetical protein DMF11_11725 [Verrucomicrobia bacterium]|nr:MAG: hypothetical protein DMF11_11725 [Verrucomicrobiota bacterium]
MAHSPNRHIHTSRDEMEMTKGKNDQLQRSRTIKLRVNVAMIALFGRSSLFRHSTFGFRYRATEQHCKTGAITSTKPKNLFDTSTHHDASICFLIQKGNAC